MEENKHQTFVCYLQCHDTFNPNLDQIYGAHIQ